MSGTARPEPRMVHAVLARWLDDDHHADRKPWSWAIRDVGAATAIEIGLVDDGLAERLITGSDIHLRSPASMRLPVAGPIEQLAAPTWPQLASSPIRPPWTLEFLSPVTFRRGSRFMPWPAPSSVFGSLRTSWRTFGARHVGDLTVDLKADPLVVVAVDGRSYAEQVVLRAHSGQSPVQVTVTGFVGHVQYAVDGPIDCCAVAALVALSPFAGVGAHTTRGFGGTRLAMGGGRPW